MLDFFSLLTELLIILCLKMFTKNRNKYEFQNQTVILFKLIK